jgi:hypothetical protein
VKAVVSNEEELLAHFGGVLPARYKKEEFCVSLADPDVYYVYPLQPVQVKWALDKTKGQSHVCYVFEKGVRDMAKVKSGAQLDKNPATLYIPQIATEGAPPVEVDVVLTYMVMSGYSCEWVYSQPCTLAVAGSEREARVLNQKRLLALKPPPPVEASAAAAGPVMEDVDYEVISTIAACMQPVAEQVTDPCHLYNRKHDELTLLQAAYKKRLEATLLGRHLVSGCSVHSAV